MFAEEAEVARKLRHPNVVRVLDGGEDDQGPSALHLAECQLHASLPPNEAILRYHVSWIAEGKLPLALLPAGASTEVAAVLFELAGPRSL